MRNKFIRNGVYEEVKFDYNDKFHGRVQKYT